MSTDYLSKSSMGLLAGSVTMAFSAFLLLVLDVKADLGINLGVASIDFEEAGMTGLAAGVVALILLFLYEAALFVDSRRAAARREDLHDRDIERRRQQVGQRVRPEDVPMPPDPAPVIRKWCWIPPAAVLLVLGVTALLA